MVKDILKNTWEDHKDYEILKQSETMVLELADKIDVMLEEFKSLEKLMKLHNNIIFKKGSEVNLFLPLFYFIYLLFLLNLSHDNI